MRMIDIIKSAAVQGVEAGSPVRVLIGTVTKTNPLEVFVEQRFTLTADFLVLSEALKELSVIVEGKTYIIRPKIKVGDKLLMLRVQGGQQYVVLDRVMEE